MAGVLTGALVMGGGAALAATAQVQAELGQSMFQLNGSTVEKAPKLVYGGTTYVQLYSIQQALKKLGLQATWNGSSVPGVFSIMGSAGTNSTSSGAGANSSSSGSTVSSATAVNANSVTQFPLSVTYPDGMKVIINSVTATSTATTLDVTISNVGTDTSADPYGSMLGTTLSDNGPAVNVVTDADSDYGSPNNSAYNALNPGESVQDTLTFGPLSTNAKNFTWYFQDFDGNTQGIKVTLS